MTTDHSQLVIAALGPDRPGLVDTISGYIWERGGNIEDSRMAVLAGEFAVIMRITGDEKILGRIESEADSLRKAADLNITLRRSRNHAKRYNSIPYKIAAVCLDHPGIVHRIASALASKRINIESLETSTYEAPITGSALFRFEAVIAVPGDIAPGMLKRELEQIAEKENLDLHFEAV